MSMLNNMISEIKKDLDAIGNAIASGASGDYPAVVLGADPTLPSISASSQSLYWSQQAAKVDVTAVTASFDGFKVDESGVYLMGAKIYEFPWVSALEGKFGTASASAREVEAIKVRVAGLSESRTRVDGRLATLRTDIDRANTIARDAQRGALDLTEDLERETKRRFNKVEGDIRVVEGSAKRAHTRLDAIDRVRRQQAQAIRTAAGAPNVTSQDPKRLKDAAEQVRNLESRVNDLLRALA
ncbi:hypothetical protein [Streptomyces sp. NPDC056291]|uniref:hypothetical protein n=1 Tax=Streptomyces sp. NPDC056291 TaxID=3345772 RepID=UPI0035D8A951